MLGHIAVQQLLLNMGATQVGSAAGTSLVATFTDDDGVLGSAHTTDSGHSLAAWFTGNNTGVILDNSLQTDGNTCRVLFSTDFNSADVEAVARLAFDGAGNIFAMWARGQHNSEARVGPFYSHFSGGTLELIERDSNDDPVGTDLSIAMPTPPSLIRMQLRGSLIKVWYATGGGEEILAFERDDITLLTEGYVGVALFGTQGQVELQEINANPFVPLPGLYRPRRVSQSFTYRRRFAESNTPRRRADEAHH